MVWHTHTQAHTAPHGPAFYFIDSLNTTARWVLWPASSSLWSTQDRGCFSMLRGCFPSKRCLLVRPNWAALSFGGRQRQWPRQPWWCWLRRLWVARGAFFEQVSGVRKSSSTAFATEQSRRGLCYLQYSLLAKQLQRRQRARTTVAAAAQQPLTRLQAAAKPKCATAAATTTAAAFDGKLQQWPAGKWGVKRTHINLNIVIM